MSNTSPPRALVQSTGNMADTVVTNDTAVRVGANHMFDTRWRYCWAVPIAAIGAWLAGCGGQPASLPAAASNSAAGSRTQAFRALAQQAIDDHLHRNPSAATDLGVHRYDHQLEDLSRPAVAAESIAFADFRARVSAIDPATLSADAQFDREQLLRAFDAGILANDVIKPWATNPDVYSSAVTNGAYVVMKRPYAPAADRLRALIDREKKMPGLLAEARRNLVNPPRIYTDIAIEQIDGNINFFKKDVPAAFTGVTDGALRAAFNMSNDAVIAALGEYKAFLMADLLPKSTGSFAFGAETYRRALAANEMIDLPLDGLLAIAERDRQANEAAFQDTAKKIDASKPADAVLASLQKKHPPAVALLKTTQGTLDSLRQFILAHHIITVPPSEPVRVKETPPFMRSTTSASMDTPGPFEQARLEGFYNMTLPDPRCNAAAQADFMRQWYDAAIANVSVHEVYPGHYLQSLYAKQFASDVRKIYGANTNVEGWAHYCEQMMLDEGFHADDPS